MNICGPLTIICYTSFKTMPLNQLYFNKKREKIKDYATDVSFDEDTMLMIPLSQRVNFESSYPHTCIL